MSLLQILKITGRVVLSVNTSAKQLMVSSNVQSDTRNVHLVWKIFLTRIGLFDSNSSMFCTDKTLRFLAKTTTAKSWILSMVEYAER